VQYRDFGKIGVKVSALGFGMMRLPTLDHKPMSKRIDIGGTTRMVTHAIDEGVNYIDTAYPYHRGKSESVLGTILKDGYRDDVLLATKSPVWLIKKSKDFDTYLDQQLRRLKTDHIDFYLFHGLNKKSWRNTVLKHGLLKRAVAAKRAGKIENIGFSFHDDLKAFKEIVDGFDSWSFCQIQYNYMDTHNQAGTKGLRYAASKGLGVVIMEPLLGGRLSVPPTQIRKMLRSGGERVAPSDLALQWVWNQPEVSVVLSGMSTLGQVKANLRSADRSGVGSLSADKLALIERVKERYMHMRPIPCTRCGYCMPCPNGVDIPSNFDEYTSTFIHHDLKGGRRTYNSFFSKKMRASSCRQCRKCEEKCPQKIRISEWMPEVHQVLGLGQPFRKT
jgi:predicted aldo/keto reductase-like oxidoreductase